MIAVESERFPGFFFDGAPVFSSAVSAVLCRGDMAGVGIRSFASSQAKVLVLAPELALTPAAAGIFVLGVGVVMAPTERAESTTGLRRGSAIVSGG